MTELKQGATYRDSPGFLRRTVATVRETALQLIPRTIVKSLRVFHGKFNVEAQTIRGFSGRRFRELIAR